MKKQIIIYIILGLSLLGNLTQSNILNIEINNPFKESNSILGD